MNRWSLSTGLMLLLAVPVRAADQQAGIEFFEKRIRPVLVQHCYECHSADGKSVKGGLLLDSREGWRRGGDSGPALVSGKPADSLLIQALKHDGLEMPPKGKLSAEIIADFEKWIEMGAPDPRKETGVKPIKREIDIEAGKQFWCFRPIVAPQVPSVRDNSWPSAPVDRFVLSKLEAANLQPIGEADRSTLLRRASFDLIGLPPSPEEIDAFVADTSPHAWETVVDRLLASPHFGERWGRHWLDVARFAESSGGGRSMIFPEAWRYRDYVIRSFNDNKPFDQFVREQLAGDLLPAESPAQREERLVATAFFVLGPTNYEEQDKLALEFDVVDEQIDTTGRAFLGMTLACVRCHDHKFDPIPTRDYYALAGIFRSTHLLIHDNVSKWLEQPLPMSPDQEATVKQHEAAVANLKKKIDETKAAEKKLAAQSASGDDAPGTPRGPIAADKFVGVVLDDSQAKKVGDWTHSQFTRHYIGDGYLHDGNKDKGQKTLTFSPAVPKPGLYEVRLAYSHAESRATNVPVEILHLDGEFSGEINERLAPPIDHRFVSLGKFRFDNSGQWYVMISNEGTDGHVTVDALQLLPIDGKETASATHQPANEKPKPAADAARQTEISLAAVTRELKDLEKQLKELTDKAPYRPMAMSVTEAKQIEETHIRIRGNVHVKGEQVPRGFLQVATYGSPVKLSDKESGRRELADWITRPTNPLTARVQANRIWQKLFGEGLCRTVDNLGTTGEVPSHPELLDYLATRLHQGWSFKSLIREIVLSSTYRLASSENSTEHHRTDQALKVDPENRLLWRQNRRRLDAEALRDAMLVTANQLDHAMFGRTMKNPKQDGPNANIGEMTYVFDDARRSVYTPVFRNRLLEIFEAFDFANPNISLGKRNVTTVPTQALYFMNSPFVMDTSRDAARSLSALPSLTERQRINMAYRITLGRPATSRERDVVTAALRSSHSATNSDNAPAWETIFQALFASVDFRFVD